MAGNDLILKVYDGTLEYVRSRGYISRLQEILTEESIDDRMKRLDVSKEGLDAVDAVHCVLDMKRTLAFMEAIKKTVRSEDMVVEAGAGTGILAILAAALKANVYAIEMNEETLILAQELATFFIEKNVIEEGYLQMILDDASSWIPPDEIDVLISENIYTGMFYEMQIPIINNLLKYLKPDGKVIPQSMRSFVVLSETKLTKDTRHGDSFSPSDAEKRLYKSRYLSKPILFDEINFFKLNAIDCFVDLEISIIRSGLLNSLLIYSPVTVDQEIVLDREDMIFMGEDIFIAIDPPLEAKEGSIARLKMAYERGGKPEKGHYEISIL
ncbi:MAG: methyltransferase domain-containing protein [Methanotrichaceae archaeon]|nr:methyltransferase domain-containing protein [Methanotrichaceae archaeon]